MRAKSEENYSVQFNYKRLHKSNPFGKLQHYEPVHTSIKKNKEITRNKLEITGITILQQHYTRRDA